ncbi:MAG TPA: UbiA family prenyltransferase [Aquabacterium sp.]|uniref:UbiA family prenyltransferase n=1 Tax=Aquabacterium sp. TaxID=1872578 RepID=UPI002E324712|nr:UbiA family prenyltransferase [Aquabacterium sp.]HEX5374097.1 UbiA family prenyltransferase [Aquabacterium sp.]
MTTDLRTPIAVDLDGSLIHTDLLLESFLLLIKRNPLYLLMLPLWLLGGKARLKAEIASRVQLNAAALPYTHALVDWLKAQKAQGHPLWLCTASDHRLAQAVADHLGLFDGVIASDGALNVSGANKARVLIERFGDKGFDYCGNHSVDLAVWQHARAAIVVNGGADLQAKARALTQVTAQFDAPGGQAKAVLKALRVHQWAKNALIFVPVAAAHKLDMVTLGSALLAFVAFSLCASSVYLLNDMLDLEADRQHHSKCKRPFASGQLSVLFGMAAAPLLLVGAFGLAAALLPLKFVGVLAVYYIATLAYSFLLKRLVMIDVLALAGLYTIRIVAGAAATAIPLSFWLLMFAIFIFLSLAMVKRYAELYAMRQQGKLKAQGRGYQVEDLHLLQSMGSASGYISILVLALYVNSPDIAVLYKHAKVAWLLVPIMLYWISRIWMQTYRGHMDDDPLVFALKDRISLLTGAAAALVLVLAAL